MFHSAITWSQAILSTTQSYKQIQQQYALERPKPDIKASTI
jgi:hypothetical protein